MVVMVSGIYGPTTGPIDARNHDNHDNHYNSPVLSTFFQKGTTTITTSPVLRVFGKKKVAKTAGKPLQKVVMVSWFPCGFGDLFLKMCLKQGSCNGCRALIFKKCLKQGSCNGCHGFWHLWAHNWAHRCQKP